MTLQYATEAKGDADMTLGELCERDIIDVNSGVNLGRVDDMAFAPDTAQITHVVQYGRLKWLGLLGREEDVYIPWNQIQKIGENVLLVALEQSLTSHRKNGKRAFLRFT